jgi:uncharacterized C2H2 Zn-finger protein
MTIHKIDSSIEHQSSQVSTVGSKGSSMQFSCPICGYVFKTRKDLLHHVEIAYRFKYHDHLVLQQIRPIHESIPSDFHAQLIQLNFFRHTLREVAEEMEVDGDEVVGIFACEPVTLDPHEQRERERSTPPLDIQIPTNPRLIVVKPAENGTVFSPYTTSSPYNYDPKSSTQARVTPPKGFMARTNDRGLETYSDNDDDDTWNCNEENGDDLVRRALGWCNCALQKTCETTVFLSFHSCLLTCHMSQGRVSSFVS